MEKNNHYINDRELFYEIVLSKGKGQLTRKAEKMLILIGQNTIKKKERNYTSIDDRNDCLQQGMLHLFGNWMKFDENRYSSALPYFTEVFKRGLIDSYYQLQNIKSYEKDLNVRFISIESSNSGKGLHSI